MTIDSAADDRINDAVAHVFQNVLGVPFTETVQMDEVEEWNSLAHIQLVMAIEQVFALELQFEEAVRMISGRAILDIIRKRTTR